MNAGHGPEESIPLAAKIRFCRINLAWSKLRRGKHAGGRQGWNLPKATLEYSLDTFSSHDIQHLLGSALI